METVTGCLSLNLLLGRTRIVRVDLSLTNKAIEQKSCYLLLAKPSDLSGFLAVLPIDSDEALVNKILSLIGLLRVLYLNRSHKSP
ncbi:hypothetical protein BN1263210165 [Stenotrophomonas maltophilia]|nr:hypothetical protein BN1263210165 [Stenotrophomonas maltophilia]